jgi:colanic acid/amylovoran biosynthesis glycosyltransferase
MKKNKPLRIAFIHNAFPVLSQTFISKEMLGLRELGLLLEIYSLFRPEEPQRDHGFPEGQNIYYLLDSLNLWRLLSAHVFFMLWVPRRYVRTVCFALQNGNRAVSVFTLMAALYSPRSATYDARQDMRLHFLLVAPLARRMRGDQIMFINSHFADAAASFALLSARLLGLQYGITAHAYDIFTPQIAMAEKLSGARFVLTCTRFNQQILAQDFLLVVRNKCRVFYHGIDTARFERLALLENVVPEILAVGQLRPKKGFPVLIAACAKLRKQQINFRCRIVGDGPMRQELADLIRAQDLEQHIQLVGAVQSVETKAFYDRADLFVLPCIIEADGDRDGIPNVIAEAMAMELPVVSTDISGIPELVLHEETGLLVPQNDVEELTVAIIRLINDKELRLRFGQNGRRRVREMFESQTCLSNLNAFYLHELCKIG